MPPETRQFRKSANPPAAVNDATLTPNLMAPGYQPCCRGGDELSARVAALRGRRSLGLPRASSARASFTPRNTGQRLPPPWRVRIDIIAVRVIAGARPSIARPERRIAGDRCLWNLRVG